MIKRNIKQYQCSLEILSPIHISSGKVLDPIDYVIQIKNNKYYRINFLEFCSNLNSDKREKLLNILETRNVKKIRTHLHQYYDENDGYEYSAKVSKEIIEMYVKKFVGARNSNEERDFHVTEFIHSNYQQYIPGSTIKGAIRTAILGKLFQEQKRNYKLERNQKLRTKPFQVLESNSEQIEMLAQILFLTKNEPKADPFRNVYVSDTNSHVNSLRLENLERINTKSKSMASVFSEVLDWEFGKEYSFNILLKELDIDTHDFNKLFSIQEDIVEKILNIKIEEIFDSLKDFAKKMIKEDKEFYNKLNSYEKKIGINFYEKLEGELKNLKANEALIRIGKGTGFHSKTLNIFSKKVEKVHSYNHIGGLPMGWAKICYREVE